MDVEVLLHGVPKGQDFYGIKEEQQQLEVFYAKSNESVKLVVEVKKKGTVSYVYYNYLRYNSVIGAGNRTGSYLGITLRVDELYLDVKHIYRMLDMAFNKYVVGTIVTLKGDTYQFTTPDFASKKADIERLQQGIVQMIQASCVASKFVKIDDSMINPITSSPECHINEVTEGALLATIKKYSKIVVSPEFKSQLEKECDKRIKEVDARIATAVAEKDKVIAEKSSTINNLNSTIASRDARITALEKENRTYKNTSDVSRHVEKVKEPINALAEYFRVKDMDSTRHAPKFGHKNFYIGIVNVCLLIFVSVITVLCLMNTAEAIEDTVAKSEYDKLLIKVKKLETDKQELEAFKIDIWAALDDQTKKEVQNKLYPDTINQTETPEDNKGKVSSCTITMTPDVDTVKVGEQYTFKVTGYKGKGEWKADGFDIKGRKDQLEDQLEVKAVAVEKEDKSDAVISYTPKGGKKVKKTYKYK